MKIASLILLELRGRHTLASNATLTGQFALRIANEILLHVKLSAEIFQEVCLILRLLNLLFKHAHRWLRRSIHQSLVCVSLYIFLLLHLLYVSQLALLNKLFLALFGSLLPFFFSLDLKIAETCLVLFHKLFVIFEHIQHIFILIYLMAHFNLDSLQHFNQVFINAFDLAFDQVLLVCCSTKCFTFILSVLNYRQFLIIIGCLYAGNLHHRIGSFGNSFIQETVSVASINFMILSDAVERLILCVKRYLLARSLIFLRRISNFFFVY